MEIKTETIMVEQKSILYVAKDGKEFPTQKECELHEKNMERDKLVEKAKELCVQKLKGVMPLVSEQLLESDVYDWFYVKDHDGFLFLNNLFHLEGVYDGNYPTLICVKFVDEEYGSDAYFYRLEDCIRDTIGFWKKFGVELDIKANQIHADSIQEKDGQYDWDEIYERAIDKPFLHPHLKAKDEARYQVRSFAMSLSAPDLEEAECPEDEVENYCNTWNLLFDTNGNIIHAKLPDNVKEWIAL